MQIEAFCLRDVLRNVGGRIHLAVLRGTLARLHADDLSEDRVVQTDRRVFRQNGRYAGAEQFLQDSRLHFVDRLLFGADIFAVRLPEKTFLTRRVLADDDGEVLRNVVGKARSLHAVAVARRDRATCLVQHGGERGDHRTVREYDVAPEDLFRLVDQGESGSIAGAKTLLSAAFSADLPLAAVVVRQVEEGQITGEDEFSDLAVLPAVKADDDRHRLARVRRRETLPFDIRPREIFFLYAVATGKFRLRRDKTKKTIVHVGDLRDVRLRDKIAGGKTGDADTAEVAAPPRGRFPFDEEDTAAVNVGIPLVHVVHFLKGEHIAHRGAEPFDGFCVAVLLFAVAGRFGFRRRNFGRNLALDDLIGNVAHGPGAFLGTVQLVGAAVLLHMPLEESVGGGMAVARIFV